MSLTPAFGRGVLLALLSMLFSLSLSGVGLASESQPSLIHLQYATFDPAREEPAIPETARLAIPATGAATYLIQFSGPVLPEWKAQVEKFAVSLYDYIPDYAFIMRAEPAVVEQLRRLPFVRWIGAYHPAYRVAPSLQRQPLDGRQNLSVVVQTIPDLPLAGLAARVEAWGGRADSLPEDQAGILRLELPAGRVQELAAQDGVLWIEPELPVELFNDVGGGGIMGAGAVRAELGLYGAGQVVAVADTGLDVGRNDTSMSADFAGRILDARSLCRGSFQGWNDFVGHGTHVAGSVLGSGKLSGSNPAGHQYGGSLAGVAPEAGLIVQSVDEPADTDLECVPVNLVGDLFAPAYALGARIHTNSWGSQTGGDVSHPEFGGYTLNARAADQAVWTYQQMVVLFAAGNDGVDANGDGRVDPDSLASPGTAKNVITVGASESYRPAMNYVWGGVFDQDDKPLFPAEPIASDRLADNPQGIAAISSRGPADDGRIKPDLVAPGTFIVSARSHDPQAGEGWGVYEYNPEYVYNGGTSMAAPLAAGAAALVREWLAEFHGLASPSAALVKAVLIHGAKDLRPGQYDSPTEIPDPWPNGVSGWGRVDLENSLNPAAPAELWLNDNTNGIYTGRRERYKLTLGSPPPGSGTPGPLRITLAWTDAPGSPSAAQALVNDLDLELLAPNGDRYAGNAGLYNSPPCLRNEKWDACNNVEAVLLPQAPPGTYTLIVRGRNVPVGPQPYALVASGDYLSFGGGQAAPVYIPLVER